MRAGDEHLISVVHRNYEMGQMAENGIYFGICIIRPWESFLLSGLGKEVLGISLSLNFLFCWNYFVGLREGYQSAIFLKIF